MIPLRRRTTNLVVSACLGLTLVAFALGATALVLRPEARGPSLLAWALVGLAWHGLSGEPWSRGNAAFCVVFSLPLVLGGLAVYELSLRFEHGLAYGASGLVAMTLLFFVWFARALVASGSADYPYQVHHPRYPRVVKRILWSFVMLVACTRPQPVEVTPDPSTRPMPPSPAPSAPPPAPPISLHSTSEAIGQRVCEPIVRCGFWSGCVWLERVDETRYRVIGGSEPKGSIFVRRLQCSPPDAGLERCAIHCGAVDAGPPCVDGLHPEEEHCLESMPPKPDTQRCLFGAGICGSLM